MREEPWYERVEREAAEKLATIMAKPMPETSDDIMSSQNFDPWEMFPAIYGSYSGDFDRCAIEVLGELVTGEKVRRDLGAEMFREMLCTAKLCSYGSSPRVCFPNGRFKAMLPDFIAKWRAYSLLHWQQDVTKD